MPVPEIAERLARAPSTIYRELKRNTFLDTELPQYSGYFAVNAQNMYERRRAVHRKLVIHPELKAAIEDALKSGWSPEQIAGRMRLEGHENRVSHETIYRFAYSKAGLEEAFYRHLPVHRRRRRPRSYRRYQRSHIQDSQSLSNRPGTVAERQEFGHWECDLMMFRKESGKVNVTSLVERVSRYTVVMRNEDRRSEPIMEALIAGLAPLPAEARQSITFDRGTEFPPGDDCAGWDRSRKLVLRPASTVAERNGREYQPEAQKTPAPLDRTDGADKSIIEVDLPEPQLNAPQMPGLPDTGRGLRE